MRTITYYYEPVRVTATKALSCPVCGKKLRRQRTFQQTISPFNKNEDGTVKTSQEVLESVRRQAEAWRLQPETCASHGGILT